MTREQIIDSINRREREVRIWDFENKKMCYADDYDGEYFWHSGDKGMPYFITQCDSTEDDGEFCSYAQEQTLMDFTGQLDLNAKKIFEGDILLFDGRHYVVFFGQALRSQSIDGAYGWCVTDGLTIYPFQAMSKAVVAGNVFENPELF